MHCVTISLVLILLTAMSMLTAIMAMLMRTTMLTIMILLVPENTMPELARCQCDSVPHAS